MGQRPALERENFIPFELRRGQEQLAQILAAFGLPPSLNMSRPPLEDVCE
jgi:hypothetical protein